MRKEGGSGSDEYAHEAVVVLAEMAYELLVG